MDKYIKGIERTGNHVALTCECVFNYNQVPNIKVFSSYYEELWSEICNSGYSKKYHPREYNYIIGNLNNWTEIIEQHCIDHLKMIKDEERTCDGNTRSCRTC